MHSPKCACMYSCMYRITKKGKNMVGVACVNMVVKRKVEAKFISMGGDSDAYER